ncbi:MAG: OmpH family outer membrane protein [Aequorivita sp.]|nr:OmpH family outer membrane protein [Aequorivita sp.]
MKTKKILFFTLSLFCFTFMAEAQKGVRIGYIDMEYILESVPEYKEASIQLEGKVQRWKQDVEKKQKEIDQMKLNLANERVLLTKELIDERDEEIKIKEDEMLQYQQDRFGPNGDLMIQRRQLVQPIQDQVFNIVQEIAEAKKYDFIFDKSADVVMLFAAKRNDISDVVLRSIERAGRRVQAANKKEQRMIEESGDPLEGPITVEEKERVEQKEERQEAIEAKKTEREEMMAQRQKERDSIRAVKKQEFEDRRQRLIEERERRRDSIINSRQNNNNPPDGGGEGGEGGEK